VVCKYTPGGMTEKHWREAVEDYSRCLYINVGDVHSPDVVNRNKTEMMSRWGQIP